MSHLRTILKAILSNAPGPWLVHGLLMQRLGKRPEAATQSTILNAVKPD